MQSLLGASEFGSVHYLCICLSRLSHNKIYFLKIKLLFFQKICGKQIGRWDDIVHPRIKINQINKFCLPYLCKIDWMLGLYFPSQNEDQ